MKLRPLSICAACVAAIALFAKSHFAAPKSPASPADARESIRTPGEYWRQPDNTFLTFPEWYLVYSPREYARLVAKQPPSQFPYWGHLGQFWRGYWAVGSATHDSVAENFEYHLMIWVIGASTTGEYGLKRLYETGVGRAAEASTGGELTDEDRLAADVAQQYVDFIDVEPWYKFDFLTPAKRLWVETPWWGSHPLRKWERRYFLTSEYLAKATYGWALKQSTESSYGEESPWTVAVLDHAPEKQVQNIEILQTFADGAVLAQLPRYQAFTRAAAALSKDGVNFLEIAGNNGSILVSVIVPESYELTEVEVLFVQPILTEPGRKRIAFTIRVPQLGATLRRLDDPQIDLEHVYDY